MQNRRLPLDFSSQATTLQLKTNTKFLEMLTRSNSNVIDVNQSAKSKFRMDQYSARVIRYTLTGHWRRIRPRRLAAETPPLQCHYNRNRAV